ncbi:MAG TPA: hypothetical protein VEN79_00170, partial [Terriglobia bacterium]|nr:hypothetical protein [Terriglobia bacterium]
ESVWFCCGDLHKSFALITRIAFPSVATILREHTAGYWLPQFRGAPAFANHAIYETEAPAIEITDPNLPT